MCHDVPTRLFYRLLNIMLPIAIQGPACAFQCLSSIDLSSALDLFTTDSLQCVSTQLAIIVTVMHYTPDILVKFIHTCRHILQQHSLPYVHTDPDGLPSFAEECSFGIEHWIHTTEETNVIPGRVATLKGESAVGS